MLENFYAYFTPAAAENLTMGNTLIILVSSLVLGLLISLTYILTHKKSGYSQSFPVTLIILPAIISLIILLVGNSVARAFSLAGAFTLIRFRSAPGNPKDIAYVFFTLAVGLGCGMGYIGYAAVFDLLICGVFILLDKLHYAAPRALSKQLKILIPENLNYQGLFDDILKKYTTSYYVRRVKTSDFGSLFEMSYIVKMRPEADEKEFLDALRTKNGNLNISLTLRENEEGDYRF